MRLLSQKERIRGFYPTEVKLPLWIRPMVLEQALASVKISDVSVRQITREFRPKLIASPLLPKLPPALNPRDYEETIRLEAPVDGTEVVEWMQISAADYATMLARMAEYNRLGSEMQGASGDAYIPGVAVSEVAFTRDLGSNVRGRGYTRVATPRGSFNVASLGKGNGIFPDLLSWGSLSYVGSVQTAANLLRWRSLAETPIRESVGFYRDIRGNAAPNFFVQRPTTPRLSVRVRQVFSSDGDQTLGISFRSPTNYSSEVGTKSVAIAGGQNETTYTVSAFPFVPPVVSMIQPQDGRQTTLDSYEVT